MILRTIPYQVHTTYHSSRQHSCRLLFHVVNLLLIGLYASTLKGRLLREGSIIDATIISAPSSTKNSTGKRDPEMHQTKKGNEWHFGMKKHIGVDDKLGLIHSIDTTTANIHAIVPTDELLHGEEQRIFGDAEYLGIQKRGEHKHRENVSWFIAKRPGSPRKLDADKLKAKKDQSQCSCQSGTPLLIHQAAEIAALPDDTAYAGEKMSGKAHLSPWSSVNNCTVLQLP